jgi:hypothetical protein
MRMSLLPQKLIYLIAVLMKEAMISLLDLINYIPYDTETMDFIYYAWKLNPLNTESYQRSNVLVMATPLNESTFYKDREGEKIMNTKNKNTPIQFQIIARYLLSLVL